MKIKHSPYRVFFNDEGYDRRNGVALVYNPGSQTIVVEGLHDSGFLTGQISLSIFEILEHVPIEDLEQAIAMKKLKEELENE